MRSVALRLCRVLPTPLRQARPGPALRGISQGGVSKLRPRAAPTATRAMSALHSAHSAFAPRPRSLRSATPAAYSRMATSAWLGYSRPVGKQAEISARPPWRVPAPAHHAGGRGVRDDPHLTPPRAANAPRLCRRVRVTRLHLHWTRQQRHISYSLPW